MRCRSGENGPADEWITPSPPRSRANEVCADATGGPSVRRKRGEGRGEGDARRGFTGNAGRRTAPLLHAMPPPHPNPLPGGERG
ncbi:hypothetical protein CRT60_20060 [Azospirillum palustre]|uniref:Uncharacterized protein n=1 Tax=Azospirillum palustre TaxID=2044885 RepID=A0A2B8BCT4_9PROT|nr:hypothetical protein CRT60_20060 [Azospirillum palustre]